MSADLFAAFAEPADASSAAKRAPQTQDRFPQSSSFGEGAGLNTQTSPLRTRQKRGDSASALWQRDVHGSDVLFDADEAEQDYDDFGDFEDAEVVEKPTLSTTSVSLSSGTTSSSQGSAWKPPVQGFDLLGLEDDPQPEVSRPKASSLDNPEAPPPKAASFTTPAARTKTDVPSSGLLDAGFEEGVEDDWGDYADVQIPQQQPSQQSQRLPTSIKATSVKEKAKNEHGPPRKAIPAATREPKQEPDDEWDAFEDGADEAVGTSKPSSNKNTTDMKKPESTKTQRHATRTGNHERPTNVPPPTTLLELLCSVFQNIHQAHQRELDTNLELGEKVLMTFRVASRIVSGRSHRWKRDTILAQSMKIGQAGKSGGMKLATVNKGESIREEREVAEMISQWSKYTHEFHAIMAHSQMAPNRLKINASPSLHIIPGPDRSKQCALCGLKRTERIHDVDVATEDLFDEFWIEHWGHRDCSEFWYTYKELLAQR